LSSQRTVIVLLVVIVLMAVEILYLIRENHRLQGIVAESSVLYNTLQARQRVPSVEGEDVQGARAELRYSSTAPHTLLMLFSPDCGPCQENAAFWQSLTAVPAGDSLRYFGLCVGGPSACAGYAAEHGLTFPVMAVTDERLAAAYNGHVLPQTAIVSPEGIVLRTWPGALGQEQQQEVTGELERFRQPR